MREAESGGSASGAFTSSDPFEGFEEDPQSTHPFAYAHLNPIRNADPTGQFTVGELQVTISIRGYLASTALSYSVGKLFSVVHLGLTEGNLHNFRWLEASDLLSLIPGAVLTQVVRLPVQMVTRRVGGKVVGNAFEAGLVQKAASDFARWFGWRGGRFSMRSADGLIIELEKGSKKQGFVHLLRRHMTGFWDGSQPDATTMWPSNISPGAMLELLSEAAGKYVAKGPPEQLIKLSNGISASPDPTFRAVVKSPN